MGATPPPPGGNFPPAGGYPPPGPQPGWTGPPPGGPPPGGPGAPPPGAPPPGGWQPPAPGSPPPPGGPPNQPGGYRGAGPQGPWQPGNYGGFNYGYAQGYGLPKAGWWARFAALFIDGLVILLLYVPAFLMLVAGPTEITTCSVDSQGELQFDGADNALCEGPTGTTVAIAVLFGLAGFAIVLTYFAILEGKQTQTWGKKALGIRTVDAMTGAPIGPGRAIGRYFGRILSGMPCYLGYLWPLWDDQKQTFHDKVVNTVVVKG